MIGEEAMVLSTFWHEMKAGCVYMFVWMGIISSYACLLSGTASAWNAHQLAGYSNQPYLVHIFHS